MALRKEIDGSKFDIRVICTGPGDSEDSGYVNGVPIDPPDKNLGWMLVDLWVEHDTSQEKGEKGGAVVTKLVNPAFYQLWARKKTPKGKRRGRKPKMPTATVVVVNPGEDLEQALTNTGVEVAPAAKPTKPRVSTPRARKAKPKKRKKAPARAASTPAIETEEAPPADTTAN